MERRTEQVRRTGHVRIGGFRIEVVQWVYGTVTLLSVLVVFDGWQDLKSRLGVVAVLVGPALALALAHLFAEVLDLHIKRGRSLRRAEWRVALVDASHFLLILVPPLAVLVVSQLLGAALRTTIALMLWMGVASLAFWGWLAGRRAALRGWRLVGAALAGLCIGLVVIGLQLVLKPH